MRIYRSAPKRSFTSLPNATTRDKHLSWTAMGILSYLLGLPDGSRTSVRQLAGRQVMIVHGTNDERCDPELS
ncbi:hypothetical protein ADL27_35850, partial [Streptomyces sp. NRRL F-6602]